MDLDKMNKAFWDNLDLGPMSQHAANERLWKQSLKVTAGFFIGVAALNIAFPENNSDACQNCAESRPQTTIVLSLPDIWNSHVEPLPKHTRPKSTTLTNPSQ